MLRLRSFLTIAFAAALVASASGPASADHSWGPYHWARTQNPFTLQLGDNLSNQWKPILGTVSADWNTPLGSFPTVLTTTVVTGNAGKNCRATTGRVEVCNSRYGFNGWVGIAQIWISGDHITKGVAKMNDSYLDHPTYSPFRRYVMCQEVGHTFGLGHTSENGTDQGTCMDYSWNNETPSAHDFEQLSLIYGHLDDFDSNVVATDGGGGKGNGKGNGKDRAQTAPGLQEDGTPVGATPARGRYYVTDLPGGVRILTHITWIR